MYLNYHKYKVSNNNLEITSCITLSKGCKQFLSSFNSGKYYTFQKKSGKHFEKGLYILDELIVNDV